jgi:magnesium transporter
VGRAGTDAAVENRERKAKITAILETQEEKAINFSTARFLTFGPETTVAQARADFPVAARRKVEITYIYVVGERETLLGVIDSKRLLLADEHAWLKEIMSTKVVTLGPHIE